VQTLVHEDHSCGVDIEPQLCRVGSHQEEMLYLFTLFINGEVSSLVFQCEKTGTRFTTSADRRTWFRNEKPKGGWGPITLTDGRIVTDSGKVQRKDQTQNIPDQDPWPALAADQYRKPTRFQGTDAEAMGF